MIEPRKYRSHAVILGAFILGAMLQLPLPGCVSSQMESSAEHPASPEAARAPLEPVGEALSANYDPGSAPASPTGGSSAPEYAHGGASETTAHEHHSNPGGDTTAADEKAAERWTCPMHPEVIQSEPGKCPKCGMKLVPMAPEQAP